MLFRPSIVYKLSVRLAFQDFGAVKQGALSEPSNSIRHTVACLSHILLQKWTEMAHLVVLQIHP